MLLTAADVRDWIGRPAMDPYGEPLGEVAAIFVDGRSGIPHWLLLADPSAREGRLAPLRGALRSGRHIRVVPTAEQVRGAPAARVGEEVDEQTLARAAAHYGLRAGGADRDGPARGEAGGAVPGGAGTGAGAGGERAGPSGAQRRELVQGLRAAHAMEQASLALLAAMRRRASDAELAHDLLLHGKATDQHAERVRLRLEELGGKRVRALELIARIGARMFAQLGRLNKGSEAVDLQTACRFEQSEADAYAGLGDLAQRSGDLPTAGLCEANRADELAMVLTLQNHRRH
jgi:ferritin-like metal-binding protein YciE